jgi:sRNA-binding carbon storage regulator CsrA
MVTLTIAVGEEIIIDGRIHIRILAIPGEEVYLEMNFPEFIDSDRNGAHGQHDESKRQRNVLTRTGEATP